ncbi:unnamed protein product [Orchesella dallaii]|uniref:Uncharacterized protein n=1 Tax=Orchesella dallaii TaxID=48710 RepID=A0ABP1RU52_9HEXA
MEQEDAVTTPGRSARAMMHAATPPAHLDLGTLANAVFDVDHTVTRMPAKLHPPIFPSIEDARAFLYSLLIYGNEVESKDFDQLWTTSQKASLDARNWNWLIRRSPYFDQATRTLAYLRLSKANVFARMMRMDPALVEPGNDKYWLTSCICYVICILNSAKQSPLQPMVDVLNWVADAHGRFLNKFTDFHFWPLAIPFDHQELREVLRIKPSDFQEAFHVALIDVIENSADAGSDSAREKCEVVEEIHRLYSSTRVKMGKERRQLEGWRRKKGKLSTQLDELRGNIEDVDKELKGTKVLFGVLKHIHIHFPLAARKG